MDERIVYRGWWGLNLKTDVAGPPLPYMFGEMHEYEYGVLVNFKYIYPSVGSGFWAPLALGKVGCSNFL
jgi:hypothetical protein